MQYGSPFSSALGLQSNNCDSEPSEWTQCNNPRVVRTYLTPTSAVPTLCVTDVSTLCNKYKYKIKYLQ